MYPTTKIAIPVLISLIAWTPSSAEKSNDAIRLLNKVRETYSSLKSFQLEGTSVAESQGSGMHGSMDFPFKADFVAPSKFRIETKNPVMAVLIVSDGQTTWLYVPSTKAYSKIDLEEARKSLSQNQGGEGREKFMAASAAAGVGIDMFEVGIADRVRQAEILREEGVELEGKDVECYVVRVEYEQSKDETDALPEIKTYWIDKNRFIVLRENWEYHAEVKSDIVGGSMNIKHSANLTKVRLNEPVADELFVFTPPAGAKEAEPSQVRPLNPAYPP